MTAAQHLYPGSKPTAVFIVIALYLFAPIICCAQTQTAIAPPISRPAALAPPLVGASCHVDIRMNPLPPIPAYPNKVVFTLDARVTGNTKTAEVDVYQIDNDKNSADFIAKGPNTPVDGSWHPIFVDISTKDAVFQRDKPCTTDNLRAFATGELPDVDHATTAAKPILVPQLSTGAEIVSLAMSPDQTLLATGSYGSTIKLWDTRTGCLVRTRFAGGAVWTLAFSPNGDTVAAGIEGSDLAVYDVSTGLTKDVLIRPQDKVNRPLQGDVEAVAFSHNGDILAAARADGTIDLWDAHTHMFERTLTGHTGRVTGVAFASNDETLYSAGLDGTVRSWSVDAGHQILSVDAKEGGIYGMALSRDGQTMATGGEDKSVRIWNAVTLTQIRKLVGHTAPVRYVAISPDGSTVASTGQDRTVKLWSVGDGSPLIAPTVLTDNPAGVHALAFTPDGQHVYWPDFLRVGGQSGACVTPVRFWSLARHTIEKQVSGQCLGAFAPLFSPDGQSFTVCAFDGMHRWDMKAGAPHWLLKGVASSFSRDGKSAAVCLSTSVEILDAATGASRAALTGSTDAIWSTSFSPDGGRIAGICADGKVFIWDVKVSTPRMMIACGKDNDPDAAVEWSPDGATIAAEVGNTIYNCNASTGTVSTQTPWPVGETTPAVFSPDSQTLAVPMQDCTVRLVDVKSGKQTNLLAGVTGPLGWAAYSPDGTLIACTRNDATIDTWNVRSGQLGRTLYGQQSLGRDIEFSPDGNIVLSSSMDGSVRIWETATGRQLCALYLFEGGDWAVVAPDGRFDTNDFDLNWQLHWLMPDNTLLPMGVFLRQYYEPRLLPRLLAHDPTLDVPVPDIASLYRQRPTIAIDRAVTPFPADLTAVTVSVHVAAPIGVPMAGKSNAVRDLRLFRDGQLVGYAPNAASGGVVAVDPATGSRTYKFPVRLPRDGRKSVTFSAYAFNCDLVKSDTDRFTYNLAVAAPVKGRAYVISLGVNRYQDPAWNLHYAAADARLAQSDIVARLTATKNYADVVGIPLVSDDSTATATRAAFKAVLASLAGRSYDKAALAGVPNANMLRKATPDDLVVITFSCHGAADTNGDFYLFPRDIGPHQSMDRLTADLKAHAIGSQDLSYWLRDVDAGRMVMVLDACNSNSSVDSGSFKPGPMDSRGLGQLAYDKGMRILTASHSAAAESPTLGHGALTYALLREGLDAGKAADTPGGAITMGQCLRYAVARVPNLVVDVSEGRIRGMGVLAPLDPNLPRFVQQPALFDFFKGGDDVTLSGAGSQAGR